MMELRGVRKRYDGREVLAGVDLAFPPARTTVLIGPSGCGKSTVLRLLVGLVRPDAGEVLFDGQPLYDEALARVRLRLGYVIQDGGLFPHLTARGNITLMARHLGRPTDWVAARLRDLADLTHFPADALDRYPAELSGGQRQRVALMRALMLQPEALLLDEPLGALDPLIRADLQDDLQRIFRELRQTVVLVTHDLAEADFFGDSLVLLRDGRVVQQGTLADLCRAPAEPFVTRFVQAQRRPALLEGPAP